MTTPQPRTPRLEYVQNSVTLRERVLWLCQRYGGLRPASRVLQMDAGYLGRIRDGEKQPSDKTLRKMGLKRHIFYTVDEKGHSTTSVPGHEPGQKLPTNHDSDGKEQ